MNSPIIDDIMRLMVQGTTWLFYHLGRLLVLGTQKLIVFGVRTNNRAMKKEGVKGQAMDEQERHAQLREVVKYFASHHGYIARGCISKEEIEQLIDNGIEPYELDQEIRRRMVEVPGIVLGSQTHSEHEIKLPYSWRDRHVYIVGRSGSGKTNSIRNMVMQDITNGCGVGILAPEAELLTEEILPYIPDGRVDDVIFINPADTEYPIPINPLHLEPGDDIDLAVDDNITIFKRIMGETGARMDEILRQSLYALLERPGSTLLDIDRLLARHDDRFRQEIIRTTKDEYTAAFFRDTYPRYPKDAHLPITTRIGRLIRPRLVRTLLCQPGVSFNFRRAMDEGKILLFNLSDGILGEQTSQLLGEMIVSKIQMAVMSRVDTPAAARVPFYLYLDEFQTFTGVAEASYEKILSRARKYRLGIVLAHQQTAQISNNLLREILGNVSTMIAFNVSHADAAKLSSEFLLDMGVETMHIQPDFFLRLKVGEAWIKIDKTVLPLSTGLADQNPDPIRAKEIIEHSRLMYGSPAAQHQRPIPQRQDDAPKPDEAPKPVTHARPPEDALDPAKVF